MSSMCDMSLLWYCVFRLISVDKKTGSEITENGLLRYSHILNQTIFYDPVADILGNKK